METNRYYAEKAVLDLPEFAAIAGRFPGLQWIESYKTFRLENLRREKQCVIFARKRSAWLKPFHCYTNKGYRYFSLDVAEGCSFDCVYCYLQSYLNHGALVLFVNIADAGRELRECDGDRLWISTGLLSDSLLAERYFPVLPSISTMIPEGSVLELRTKAGDLRPLRNPAIDRERIVVAWSLNPQKIVSEYEYGTASLQQRLEAAKEATSIGYRVAFHFDPVFYFGGWKESYSELFYEIASFPPKSLAFLSVGLFRYMPELGTVIRKRFPFHPILTGEFFPNSDGKYHYLRGLRKEMYSEFSRWLEPWRKSVPIFLSMEPNEQLNKNISNLSMVT